MVRVSSRVSVCSASERQAVEALPDLSSRIHELGLTDEYMAFRERYLAWRRGDKIGARGEITSQSFARRDHFLHNRGFGDWYPDVQEWVWRRTMAYWIAVTFFEASIFFMISSFACNYASDLGPYLEPMTLYGYYAGALLFLISTYFMCLETLNVQVGADCEAAFGEDDVQAPFFLNPFRIHTALRDLEAAGVGPLPYLTSLSYFSGSIVITLGTLLSAAFDGSTLDQAWHWSFLLGATLFLIGGFLKCAEHFRNSSRFDMGWCGVVLDVFGGLGFLAGALMALWERDTSESLIGCGAVMYMATSSVQIIMWKDEQFGLTFMSVLNSLGDSAKLAALASGGEISDETRNSTFSMKGAFFIHVYCLCGTTSTYNFLIGLKRFLDRDFDRESLPLLLVAFTKLLPCLIAHCMLALTSAQLRTPKAAPFKQLYSMARYLCLALMLDAMATLYQFLQDRTE